MNWVDYCIVAALALSVLMGLWRGFIAEVMAIACWVLAFWAAYAFGAILAEKFSTSIALPSARLLLGYAICFLTVLLVGAVFSFFMRKLVAGSGLSGSDRLLGMVFGLVRGLALMTLAVLILGFTPFPRDPWWRESTLLPSFQASAQWLAEKLPADVGSYLNLHDAVLAPVQLPKPAQTKPAADPADGTKKSSTL